MFQHIVVPLDGSKRAEQALPLAARLARASGGSLLLIRVVLAYEETVWYGARAAAFIPELLDESTAKAERYLQQVVASQKLEGMVKATEVLTGHPAEAILSAAKANQADLIVMCSHGYTGAKRWVLGSVTQKVARHSEIPVLLLREGAALPKLPPEHAQQPFRIMVALDGSTLAESVLEPAASLSATLSAPARGALHLVRVLRIPTTYEYGQSDMLAQARTEATREAKAYLSTVSQRLQKGDFATLDLSITSTVDDDLDVAQRLISLAENDPIDAQKAGCDMIALATHGRSGLARWVMGSTTERILGATPLPLLIVRPPRETFPAPKDNEISQAERREEAPNTYPWTGLL